MNLLYHIFYCHPIGRFGVLGILGIAIGTLQITALQTNESSKLPCTFKPVGFSVYGMKNGLDV
jgi:hypothetical protein